MGRSLLEGAGNISVQKSGVGLGRNEERQKQGQREKGGGTERREKRGRERRRKKGEAGRGETAEFQVAVCCLWLSETEVKFKWLQN